MRARWRGPTFFQTQMQPLQHVPNLGDAQPHPPLFGQDALQLRQRPVGTILDRSQQAGLGWSIHAADRPMTLLDTVRVSIQPLLPVDLLHPAKAHPDPWITLRSS